MRRGYRIALFGLAAVMLLAAGGGIWLYLAVHHVPHFYAQALKVEPATQRHASDEMVRHTAALSNDVRHDGSWQASFSTDQINGWLAVDLVQNHARMLPAEFHEPRVAIHKGQMIIGCRYESPRISSVLSLTADVYLQEPNVLALRIRQARAGAVPLPLKDVMGQIVHTGENFGFIAALKQIAGDPLLLLTLPAVESDGRGGEVHVDSVELREGELFLAGHTQRPTRAAMRTR